MAYPEKRQSRIKDTIHFIRQHTGASLLNNHKWIEIFEWVESHSNPFELKTLLSSQSKSYSHVLEVEPSAVLVDHDGNFIEFLEIEWIRLKHTALLTDFLDQLRVNYEEEPGSIKIHAYYLKKGG